MDSLSSTHEIPLSPFTWTNPGISSLSNIDYSKVVSIGRSECGSSGVIFLETNEGSFCVKSSSETIAIEYFSYLLFNLTCIKIPKMILVPYPNEQWYAIRNTIEVGVFKDDALRRSMRKKLDSPILILMEYIPNITITYMGPKKAEKAFGFSTDEGIDRNINFGKILGLDCFTNNSDRYPLIWDNSGNPENLILQLNVNKNMKMQEVRDPNNMDVELGEFYAIDNRINLLDKNCKYSLPNLIIYYEKFDNLLVELSIYLNNIMNENKNIFDIKEIKVENNFTLFKKIKKLILKFSYYDLTLKSEFLMVIGMVCSFYNLYRLKIKGIEILINLLKEISHKYDDNWNENFNKINVNFMNDLMEKIDKFINNNQNIIEWVNKITENKYIIDYYDENNNFIKNKIENLLKENENTTNFKEYIEETSKKLDLLKKQRAMEIVKRENEIWKQIQIQKDKKKAKLKK